MESKHNESLITARKNRNLLQEQVANAVDISVRHYRKIEAGECKPNVETAISIAEFLDADVTDLFSPQRELRENAMRTDCSSKEQGGKEQKAKGGTR